MKPITDRQLLDISAELTSYIIKPTFNLCLSVDECIILNRLISEEFERREEQDALGLTDRQTAPLGQTGHNHNDAHVHALQPVHSLPRRPSKQKTKAERTGRTTSPTGIPTKSTKHPPSLKPTKPLKQAKPSITKVSLEEYTCNESNWGYEKQPGTNKIRFTREMNFIDPSDPHNPAPFTEKGKGVEVNTNETTHKTWIGQTVHYRDPNKVTPHP